MQGLLKISCFFFMAFIVVSTVQLKTRKLRVILGLAGQNT